MQLFQRIRDPWNHNALRPCRSSYSSLYESDPPPDHSIPLCRLLPYAILSISILQKLSLHLPPRLPLPPRLNPSTAPPTSQPSPLLPHPLTDLPAPQCVQILNPPLPALNPSACDLATKPEPLFVVIVLSLLRFWRSDSGFVYASQIRLGPRHT